MTKFSILILCSVVVGSLLFIKPVLGQEVQQVIDTDSDGLSDNDETAIYHTDPTKVDTDGDGYPDGVEVKNGYSPLVGERKTLQDTDTDGDGLKDAIEISLGTNLTNSDTDGDSINDGAEVKKGDNPLKGEKDRSLPRKVEVNLSTQQLDYFLNNVKIGSMPISSGLKRTPTPVGEYKIMRKVPVVHYIGPGYNLPNTKWNMEFKRSYYLHGAYWHNQFGKRPMSHGCVNIAYKDVEKLYTFLDVGDKVVVKGKTPTGALISKN